MKNTSNTKNKNMLNPLRADADSQAASLVYNLISLLQQRKKYPQEQSINADISSTIEKLNQLLPKVSSELRDSIHQICVQAMSWQLSEKSTTLKKTNWQ
jgi:hypothetical protein